ncbi:hypothetical protein AnigIFM49718_006102 [Aspergillus niger]|nr:hypothetical protein AnigIFM49718_006102 [Aspergillus niger]
MELLSFAQQTRYKPVCCLPAPLPVIYLCRPLLITLLVIWQGPAVWTLWRIWCAQVTKGAILADAVGLRKTIESIAFILTVARGKRNKLQAGEKVTTKPTLIVVPPHLLDQWSSELRKLSNKLDVCLYFGDNRTQTGSSLYVKNKLTKKHPMFQPDFDGRYSVVPTTYNTLEKRCGLSAVSEWHKNKYSEKYKPTDSIPSDFPHSLSGCFDLVICDEAHYLRNGTSDNTARLSESHIVYDQMMLSLLLLSLNWYISGWRSIMLGLPGNIAVEQMRDHSKLKKASDDIDQIMTLNTTVLDIRCLKHLRPQTRSTASENLYSWKWLGNVKGSPKCTTTYR